MAKGEFLGEFEQMIMLAVLRLGNDASVLRSAARLKSAAAANHR